MGARRKLKELEIDTLVAMYKRGASTDEIGAAFHIARRTVNARLRERGVDTRRRGKRKRCKDCLGLKLLEEFHVNTSYADGRASKCKRCSNHRIRVSRAGRGRPVYEPRPDPETVIRESIDRRVDQKREQERDAETLAILRRHRLEAQGVA